MATYGRGLLGRLLWGYTTAKFVQRAPAPVLLVRGDNSSPRFNALPAFNRIVVPLDGSKYAENALVSAAHLGRYYRSQSTLLHALTDATHYASEDDGYLGGDDGQRHPAAFSYLHSLMDRWRTSMPDIGAAVVQSDKRAEKSILKYCERLDADLIALTISDRSSLARLMHGSVADALIRKSRIPLLLSGPNVMLPGSSTKRELVSYAG